MPPDLQTATEMYSPWSVYPDCWAGKCWLKGVLIWALGWLEWPSPHDCTSSVFGWTQVHLNYWISCRHWGWVIFFKKIPSLTSRLPIKKNLFGCLSISNPTYLPDFASTYLHPAKNPKNPSLLKSSIELLNQLYFLNIYGTKLNNAGESLDGKGNCGSHKSVTCSWAPSSACFKYSLHAFSNLLALVSSPKWIPLWEWIGLTSKGWRGFLPFWVIVGLLLEGDPIKISIVVTVVGPLSSPNWSTWGLGYGGVVVFVYANSHLAPLSQGQE